MSTENLSVLFFISQDHCIVETMFILLYLVCDNEYAYKYTR
ncbi:hypothetical protein SAMN05428962_1903 [Paenibacillus sp. BC26]|nr:hypothetical protein SAMN05428962_1903 [Paenibacillus sp. BC26]